MLLVSEYTPPKKSALNSLRKRLTLTHECCINEGVSQSYVGQSVVSLLSIPTMGEGQDITLSTTLQPKVVVGKV